MTKLKEFISKFKPFLRVHISCLNPVPILGLRVSFTVIVGHKQKILCCTAM